MKTSLVWFVLGLALAGVSAAQVVLPPHPRRPITGPSVGGGTGSVTIQPQEKVTPKQRLVTHVVLAETRTWQSTDGKSLRGTLIAFEDAVSEIPAGGIAPPAPRPPQYPTVVRDGKVRLMIDKKAHEIPLTRLIKADQEFIEQIRVRLAKPPTDPP